ncbi:MAG TPA: 50S ribosomal protein L9 [Anaerolineales bacterium]|nr:50S ribosomal protein L9 [Anaerolineales bacterium]
MKVLLLKDVYKLGRAGDVKKVADGFGRNFLLPQKLAVLATPSALKQVEHIRQTATVQRARLNQELGGVAEQIEGLELIFAVKAGETGKLYGSITPGMIGEAVERKTGVRLDKRQIDTQPIKTLGVHSAAVRLTIDLIPKVSVVVHREGEPPESAYAQAEVPAEVEEQFADLKAELEAQEETEARAESIEMVENEEEGVIESLPAAGSESTQEPLGEES